jgi:DNA repair exonuclease SbcCD ATPase subunit
VKITNLKIHNVGIIEHFDMPVNKSLNLFYGDIKQGKTTILNAIRWAFGGEYPADIMRHGQTEAYVEIAAEDDGVPLLIRREWYVNKEGETTNRPLVFQRAGVDQSRPAETLKRFLNPFVLDDRYFVDMTPLEKGRYLCRLFGIDTKAEDAAIGAMSEEASQLRIKIKAYGEVVPVEVLPIDTAELLAKRKAVVDACESDRATATQARALALASWRADCERVEADNSIVRKRMLDRQTCAERIVKRDDEIADLERQIAALEAKKQAAGDARVTLLAWLESHQALPEKMLPAKPDTSELDAIVYALPDVAHIDARIQQAGAVNEQHKQYLRDLAKSKEKAADEAHLLDLERKQAQLKADKVAKLARLGAESGIPTMEFLDGGDFRFDGTSSDMLSDSQQMQLTECLKGKYPEGFNVSLVDRGESLGKSVMTLVERARVRQSTIFCSVVGERPANIPEDIGAFVVEKGKVTL